MGVSHVKNQFLAGFACAVTDANQFEGFGETFGYSAHHVAHYTAGRAVQGTMQFVVRRTFHEDLVVFNRNLDVLMKFTGQSTFRSFYRNDAIIKCDIHTTWYCNWFATNTRHLLHLLVL
ncbi:hypothetical protein D1872_249810 [compost metagenome]